MMRRKVRSNEKRVEKADKMNVCKKLFQCSHFGSATTGDALCKRKMLEMQGEKREIRVKLPIRHAKTLTCNRWAGAKPCTITDRTSKTAPTSTVTICHFPRPLQLWPPLKSINHQILSIFKQPYFDCLMVLVVNFVSNTKYRLWSAFLLLTHRCHRCHRRRAHRFHYC